MNRRASKSQALQTRGSLEAILRENGTMAMRICQRQSLRLDTRKGAKSQGFFRGITQEMRRRRASTSVSGKHTSTSVLPRTGR